MGASSDREKSATRGFLVELAEGLHRYGIPAHRLEEAMAQLSERLGERGQFFATPTSIFMAFGEVEDQRTHLVRMTPGDVDLEKLTHLDRLMVRVAEERMPVPEARRELRWITQAPARYGRPLTTLCFALVSASAARFFGGGFREILVAGLIGLVTGLWALLVGRWPHARRLFAAGAAFLAALIAEAGCAWWGPSSAGLSTMSGLIVLLPGLSLTVAMNELAASHLASGSIRFAGVLGLFLEIGVGVALGSRVAELLLGPACQALPTPLPGWTLALALGIAPLTFAVLFRASPSDLGAILLAGVVAFLGARLGATHLGSSLGGFVGALLVAAFSNALARLRRRPVAVTMVPGILLLVPGSLGFGSLSALLANDVVSGMQAAFGMALTAVALVAGLLAGNVLVPPRRSL